MSFRFSTPVEIRFRDIDALGHVNNAVYLTYLESARMAYWTALTGESDLRTFNIILARVEIDYRSPVVWGDKLDVAVRCATLGRASCTLELRLTETTTERLVAEARNVVVYFDYAARRPQPIPEALRARIRDMDPGVDETGGGV